MLTKTEYIYNTFDFHMVKHSYPLIEVDIIIYGNTIDKLKREFKTVSKYLDDSVYNIIINTFEEMMISGVISLDISIEYISLAYSITIKQH